MRRSTRVTQPTRLSNSIADLVGSAARRSQCHAASSIQVALPAITEVAQASSLTERLLSDSQPSLSASSTQYTEDERRRELDRGQQQPAMSVSSSGEDEQQQEQHGDVESSITLSAAAAQKAAIASLQATAPVQEFLTQAVKEYQESRAHWETASAVLKKALTNLAANRIGKGQIPSYVSSARPPANTTAPATLYASIIDQLKKHEQDGIQIVLKARVELAQKTLDWYKGKINVQSLVAAKQEEFVQTHLLSYADKYDASFADAGDENSKFPRAAMQAWIQQQLLTRITTEFTRGIQRQESEEQAKKDEAAKDLAAQEQVMAGAHNGKTLEAMMEAFLEKREAAKLKAGTADVNNASAAAGSGVLSNTRLSGKPQQNPPSERREERPGLGGHKRARSPGQGQAHPRQDAAFRQFPGHKFNGPRRPFNGNQAAGHPNTARLDSPPTNGVGGDRHNGAHPQFYPWQQERPIHHEQYNAPLHYMRDNHGEGRGWHERPPQQWSHRHR